MTEPLLYRLRSGSPLCVIGALATSAATVPEPWYRACVELLAFAARFGLSGNIWQSYVTWEILRSENPWSLACEGRADPGGSLSRLAASDLDNFQRLFSYDFPEAPPELRDAMLSFDAGTQKETQIGALLRGQRDRLAQCRSRDEFTSYVAEFYRFFGVGRFAFHHAFQLTEEGRLTPVPGTQSSLQDLVGYTAQKEQLCANTNSFLAGLPSHNVLLYGDAGTGKSTCVRSLLSDYKDTSLRMVELSTTQFARLTALLSELRTRNYKFILFIDDLSFEAHETGYKHLKAVMEGGLEQPENVRIYATSNRRHLIQETWNDKADMEHDGDLHRSDTVEEKLSLAARFGIALHFPSPARREYYEIVKALAAAQLPERIPEETLLREADRWEIRHGGLSGRTAQQYIDYLAGHLGEQNDS